MGSCTTTTTRPSCTIAFSEMQGYLPLLLAASVCATANFPRRARDALPQEIFRESVEPEKGGKVPESAHMRIELNKIDSAGLDNAEALRMVDIMAAQQLGLPERLDAGPSERLVDTNSGYQPGRSQVGLNPNLPFSSTFPDFNDFSPDFPFNPVFDSNKVSSDQYQPNPYPSEPYHDEPHHHPDRYTPGSSPVIKLRPEYQPEPAYQPPAPAPPPFVAPVVPTSSYGAPATYTPAAPAYVQPAPPAYVEPAAPAYHAPVGPVLLDKRPYEVKSVQPLPITVAETYTGFDCRSKPYQNRHYADPEAGCEIYHFCHADGKQDTYHCGYGTLFNEYLGTCDYKNNVHCTSGDGYAPAPAPYHPPAPAYHQPEPAISYHQPAPYVAPVQPSYVEPAPYQPPASYGQPSQAFTAFGKK